MIKIGNYNRLTMERTSDYGAYLGDGFETVLLPNKYVPATLRCGDEIEVFVYTDSEDRPVATTLRPCATVDEFAAMTVKSIIPAGAFLDWGLEKDLFAPRLLQIEPMIVGERYVVRVTLDRRTNRAVATSKIRSWLKPVEGGMLNVNQQVPALIYEKTITGFLAITAGKYGGMLYHNQIFAPLEIGQTVSAYVAKIREDGKVDLSLQPLGYVAAVPSAEKMILAALTAAGGTLPVTAKTGADEIESRFQMSRKTFKKALGSLYKERLVSVTEAGISLLPEQK